MTQRTRRIFIGIVAAAVLAAATLAFLLSSLKDGDVRAGIEARLSGALGQPVSIGEIGVSLFPPSLSGSEVRIGESGVQAPALDIGRIRILPRFRSLFSGNVIVEQLTLDEFVVSVLRDERGAWRVPAAVPAPTPAGASSGPVVERVRISNGRVRVFDGAGGELREASSIDNLDAEMRVENGGLVLSPITGRIGAAQISGEAGTDASGVRLDFTAKAIGDGDLPAFLRLLGSDRPEFLRLSEPAFASAALRVDRATSQLSGKGMLSAPKVRLEPLQLEKFEAPFTIHDSRLVFQPTTFTLYGGTHAGGVTVQMSETPPLWNTDSRVSGLDAGDFLSALAGRDQRLDGAAAATASLRGRVGEPLDRGVSGRLQITVTDGVIRDFPMLTYINRALRLADDEGTDTKFERLSGTFAVAAGQGTTDDLVLQAAHLRVQVSGRIGVDRSLAMRGIAVISPERSARAVSSIRELSALRNRSGELELPLTIGGTLDAPSFGLDLKAAIGKSLENELRRHLNRFIKR